MYCSENKEVMRSALRLFAERELFVGNKTLDLPLVGNVGNDSLTQVPFTLRALLIQNVRLVSMTADGLTVL